MKQHAMLAAVLLPALSYGGLIVSVGKGSPGAAPITSTEYLEENWTSTAEFTNVTISAFVAASNGSGTAATAYLAKQVGASATNATLVAQANLTLSPLGQASPELVLFSGLDLLPGTYFLVLASADTTSNQGWFNGNLGTATTDSHVTFNPPGFVSPANGTNSAYPPASTFNPTYSVGFAFDVTGDLAGSSVPEPSAIWLCGAGFLLLGLVRARGSRGSPVLLDCAHQTKAGRAAGLMF